jgi:hypothetical protein
VTDREPAAREPAAREPAAREPAAREPAADGLPPEETGLGAAAGTAKGERPTTAMSGPGRRERWRRAWAGSGRTSLSVLATVVVVALVLDVARLDRRVGQLATQVGKQPLQRALAAALADPRAQRATLLAPRSSSGSGTVEGMVVIEPDGRGYLGHLRLPAQGMGSTYQLWLQTAGPAISVALLGDRPGLETFRVDPGVPATALFVSIEPAGGSVQPTTPPAATASITTS